MAEQPIGPLRRRMIEDIRSASQRDAAGFDGTAIDLRLL
jgi:hypothetical protein